MQIEWWQTGLGALVLASIHLMAGNLTLLNKIPRSKWLSFGSGVSVAYIFIHVLPELEEWQLLFDDNGGFLNHHLYLLSLAGLAGFYGLERAAKMSRESERRDGKEKPVKGIFYIHLISFAIYNGLIGYLLVHRDTFEVKELVFYVFAMSFHFLINDFSLSDHYPTRYSKYGRFILAGTALAGWGIGMLTEITQYRVAIIFGLISGGVILNVLKEELPEERKSNYLAFIGGALFFAGLLLLI